MCCTLQYQTGEDMVREMISQRGFDEIEKQLNEVYSPASLYNAMMLRIRCTMHRRSSAGEEEELE